MGLAPSVGTAQYSCSLAETASARALRETDTAQQCMAKRHLVAPVHAELEFRLAFAVLEVHLRIDEHSEWFFLSTECTIRAPTGRVDESGGGERRWLAVSPSESVGFGFFLRHAVIGSSS